MSNGFCGSGGGQQTGSSYQYVNPLGPSKNGQMNPSGAPELAGQVFNYLGQYLPQANSAAQAYGSAATTAASNPGWNTVANNANATAAGDYLAGSPELNTALAYNRAQTESDAAGQDARIRSMDAKNGMGFSTTDQQAQEANNAAANASANATDANTYAQNYLAERQNQMNAGNNLATATGVPLQYLSGVAGSYTQPLSNAASIISGLGSGGQMIQKGSFTNQQDNPSMGSSIMSGIGSL